MHRYTIGAFAQQAGVAVHTLQRWDREGRLRSHRTISNRRYYTDADLAVVLRIETALAHKRCVAYCRVFRAAQKPDLAHQRHSLEQFCRARGLAVDEWLEEIGGGLHFQRKRFLALVDGIVAGEIGTLVIAHKDRLARFGFPLLAHLCEAHHCDLIVMNTESLSPEAELVQDLMTILHSFSIRLFGLRTYRQALKEALAHGGDHHHRAPHSPEPNA